MSNMDFTRIGEEFTRFYYSVLDSDRSKMAGLYVSGRDGTECFCSSFFMVYDSDVRKKIVFIFAFYRQWGLLCSETPRFKRLRVNSWILTWSGVCNLFDSASKAC